MSQRLPDYESYREAQARSQQADRIGPDPQRNDHRLLALFNSTVDDILAAVKETP